MINENKKITIFDIVPGKDGSYGVKVMGLDKIAQRVLPRIITAFENMQTMLKEKEHKVPVLA